MAQSEVWLREVNERLEQRALEKGTVDETFEIVCECDREDCTDRIRISFASYERIRANPSDFVVTHGHRDAAIEGVVDRRDVFDIVTKMAEPVGVAEPQDPRG